MIVENIGDLLPGFNCGKCGFRTCSDLGEALLKGNKLELCPYSFSGAICPISFKDRKGPPRETR